MFVKLFDGTPHIAKMPEAEAREAGYKLAVFSDKPIADTGYHAESYWTEDAETCTQRWRIISDEDEDLDDTELLNILMGGAE